MKKINENKIELIKKLFMVFLMLTPIFDMVFFFSRITTLVRISIIWLFLLCLLIYNKDSRKNFKFLLLYYAIFIIYLVISYIHSSSFHSLVPGNFNYSVLSEGFTLLKLAMPVTILYILKYLKLTKDEYFKVANVWTLFIAGSIIILNITKLSLSSYDVIPIQHSIFEWTSGLSYNLTASRGYFVYPNQVAVISLLLLVLSVYEFLYRDKKYLFNVTLLSVVMIMLGTRVSTAGGIIVLICLFVAYIILGIINKGKIKWGSCLLLIPIGLWLVLLPISPFANRNVELALASEIVVDKENMSKPIEEIDDAKIQYVYENYNKDYLPNMFFEDFYPIEYDADFWYEFVRDNEISVINYRYVEMSIIKRVVEINNNSFDILFGISNTRIQNIVNVERDFLLHYFAYGIVGSIIMLIIYVVLPIFSTIKFIKNRTYFNFAMTSVVGLYIISAYLTGNIINSMTTIITFSFIASGIFINDKGASEKIKG